MLGPTNRRRSRLLIATALLALVAQGLLVGASPLADIHYHHYHRLGPVQVESAGSGHVSRHSGPCPECLALQTMAVLGSPADVLRSNWTRQEAPAPPSCMGQPAVRSTSRFARAPPLPPSAIL